MAANLVMGKMQMEELNYIVNNHTQEVFYLLVVLIFGSVSIGFLMRNMRRKNRGRRFDDRR